MGIDCDIVMRVTEGTIPESSEFSEYYDPNLGEIRPLYYSRDIGQRWFDPSYPRGYFPEIAKAILEAISDENCEAVFLANDFGLGDELSPETFMTLCKTWYENDGRFRKRSKPNRNISWSNTTA